LEIQFISEDFEKKFKKNFVKALNLDKVLVEVETHSPDCSGYPTASLGKSFGARSNSGKRD